jgi:epoxyqueuosine reductase
VRGFDKTKLLRLEERHYRCNTKMAQDVEDAAGALATSEEDRKDLASTMNAFEEVVMALPPAGGEARYGVKYCRRCELSCPVGR